jgi:hypothetical protein
VLLQYSKAGRMKIVRHGALAYVFVDENAIRHHSVECNLNVPKAASPRSTHDVPAQGWSCEGRVGLTY